MSGLEGFPMNSKFIPTTFAEGAGEDHVLNLFLYVQTAEEAIMIISNVVMPPFEHIPRVESIME